MSRQHLETSEALFNGLFFDSDRYDLSSVGRVKLNARVGLDVDDQVSTLRRDDILAIVRILLDLKDGKGEIDDIDHLGNRRVRSVGELMENQYRIGLLRMERAIKERMGSGEIDTQMPADLINSKPAVAAVREFLAHLSFRHSLWTKQTRFLKLPTSVVFQRLVRVVLHVKEQGLKSVTCIQRIMAVSVRLKHLKVRTLV